MKTPIIKRYKELALLPTYEERFDYLNLAGFVGVDTFGFDRVFNQMFYKSREWRDIRDYVIVRDNGCDLGDPDHPIIGQKILVHHMNPIALDDISNASDFLLNPDFLICTTQLTHNAIHYGTRDLVIDDYVERSPYDTCPWKKQGGV